MTGPLAPPARPLTLAAMSIRATLVLAVLLTAPALAAMSAAEETWELRNGQWVQVRTAAATQQTASDPQLDSIEASIASAPKEAFRRAVKWLRSNRRSAQWDRGLYVAAESLYAGGNRTKAFLYCDELLDERAESSLFGAALELQYKIADEYVGGYRSRFLGIPFVSNEADGVEMLYRIQSRSPGSEIAERSLLRTGDFYYADGQFDLAGDVYNKYAELYPRSPNVEQVSLRQAYSYYAQFRGVRFDPTTLLDARQKILELIARYPELAQKENLPSLVNAIDATLARKLYVTADFYRRTHALPAAAKTYSNLIAAYPDSPEAGQAKTRLAALPESAKAFAAPSATQPLSMREAR